MTAKSSSSSTLLVIILLIITFPFWIGIIGGLFGLIAGAIGAMIGMIAGVIGAVFGGIGSVFGIFDWFPTFHLSGFRFFIIVSIIFAIVMMSRSKKK
ncbi:MAG TPA: hypothetical protein VFU05_08910 [Cyclobacteriaceae bacterium]|nr:hypothetical protein [Cyclobacteriaceae bacterium]